MITITLGEKIQAARKQAGLTQEQLAGRLHVSRAAVAKWESGAGTPDLLNLNALGTMFGVSMEDLLNKSVELPTFHFREECNIDDYTPRGPVPQRL